MRQGRRYGLSAAQKDALIFWRLLAAIQADSAVIRWQRDRERNFKTYNKSRFRAQYPSIQSAPL